MNKMKKLTINDIQDNIKMSGRGTQKMKILLVCFL